MVLTNSIKLSLGALLVLSSVSFANASTYVNNQDQQERQAFLAGENYDSDSLSLFATFVPNDTDDHDDLLLKKKDSILAALPEENKQPHNPTPELSTLDKDNPKASETQVTESSQSTPGTNIFDHTLSDESLEHLNKAQNEYLTLQTKLAKVESLAAELDHNFALNQDLDSLQEHQNKILDSQAILIQTAQEPESEGSSKNDTTYQAYDEELERSEHDRIFKQKNRVFYPGTVPNEQPRRIQYDTNANNLTFSERADLDFYLNDANSERPNYDEHSHYGLDEIEVDPNIDLNDFKTFSDDSTLLYNSLLDSMGTDDTVLGLSEASDNITKLNQGNRVKKRQIHNSQEKYLDNLIYQDHNRYSEEALKSMAANDSNYDPKNLNWEVKKQGKSYSPLSKEGEILYANVNLDISSHDNDKTNDIDESRIKDYIITENDDNERSWKNTDEVITRTRITTYALRFKDNPFLSIEKLQKKQSSCINGRGYSCYLVGRHYDSLASLSRNNKNRIIAASELAKAHELYPHINVTGADFDHLLHTIVFFRRGCHLKHSLSCRLLLSTYGRYGGLIALGKTTVNDKQLGVRYLETGCQFEEPRSCANLAAMHINGYGNFAPNTLKGINYYVRSCRIARTVTNELRLIDPNIGIGCLELGRMYLYGASFNDGATVEQNYIKAHHYLHYACNLRSAVACKMLKEHFTNHEYIKQPSPITDDFAYGETTNTPEHLAKKIMVTPLNLGIAPENKDHKESNDEDEDPLF